MRIPDSTLMNYTKAEIIEQLHLKDNFIDTLSKRVQELEAALQKKEAAKIGQWKKDEKGVIRCTKCGAPAPKTTEQFFYAVGKRIMTPYCMKCGAKMVTKETDKNR